MKFSAKEIAALAGGKVEGNPDALVSQLAKIEEGKPGALSFLSNPSYAPFIYTTHASVVIVNEDFVKRVLKRIQRLILLLYLILISTTSTGHLLTIQSASVD